MAEDDSATLCLLIVVCFLVPPIGFFLLVFYCLYKASRREAHSDFRVPVLDRAPQPVLDVPSQYGGHVYDIENPQYDPNIAVIARMHEERAAHTRMYQEQAAARANAAARHAQIEAAANYAARLDGPQFPQHFPMPISPSDSICGYIHDSVTPQVPPPPSTEDDLADAVARMSVTPQCEYVAVQHARGTTDCRHMPNGPWWKTRPGQSTPTGSWRAWYRHPKGAGMGRMWPNGMLCPFATMMPQGQLKQCRTTEKMVLGKYFHGAHVMVQGDRNRTMYIVPSCPHHNHPRSHDSLGHTMYISSDYLAAIPGCDCAYEDEDNLRDSRVFQSLTDDVGIMD